MQNITIPMSFCEPKLENFFEMLDESLDSGIAHRLMQPDNTVIVRGKLVTLTNLSMALQSIAQDDLSLLIDFLIDDYDKNDAAKIFAAIESPTIVASSNATLLLSHYCFYYLANNKGTRLSSDSWLHKTDALEAFKAHVGC